LDGWNVLNMDENAFKWMKNGKQKHNKLNRFKLVPNLFARFKIIIIIIITKKGGLD